MAGVSSAEGEEEAVVASVRRGLKERRKKRKQGREGRERKEGKGRKGGR